MGKQLKILLIGGNSFLAKSFIQFTKLNCTIGTVVRNAQEGSNELIVSDYFQLNEENFRGIDVVINCTAIVHQRKFVDELLYNKINFELAFDLARKAKKEGVKSFIQISSVAVYGKADYIDSSSVEVPVNPYGKSKLKADESILQLADEGFKAIIIRPPMVYGGKDAPGNMQRLIKLVNYGIPLPFRNAINKRDFINIRNLVSFMEAAIEKGKTGIYLVSDNESVSTLELIKIISKKLEKKCFTFPIPSLLLFQLKKYKPQFFEKLFGSLKIDTSSSINKLNFSPKNSVEQGLEEMIQNLKQSGKL